MPFSTRTVSIAIAILLSLAMLALSYWLSSPLHTQTATAESMQELLSAYAKKDTDSDGLPDWQESLYDTDTTDAHSVTANLTDSEAVAQGLVEPKFESQEPLEEIDPATLPGTTPAQHSLTDSFARMFLEQYLVSTGGQSMPQAEQEAFVSFLMTDLSQQVADTLVSKYTMSSLARSSDLEIMTYIDNVERMLTAYNMPADGSSFLLLAEDLIERGDPLARAGILRRAVMYENMTKATLGLTVPTSLAPAHLQMLRSFDTLARLMRAVAEYEEDPLLVPGALSLYIPAGMDSVTAMRAMVAAARAHGGAEGTEPGVVLLRLIGETP